MMLPIIVGAFVLISLAILFLLPSKQEPKVEVPRARRSQTRIETGILDPRTGKEISQTPQEGQPVPAILPVPDKPDVYPDWRPLSRGDLTAQSLDDLSIRVQVIEKLPSILHELHVVINDPKSTAREVAQIAGTDPIIASRILQTVNSAAFGLTSKINDLYRAVVIVGYNEVKHIAMESAVSHALLGKTKKETALLASLWAHSFQASTCAFAFAKRAGRRNAGAVATMALLHDIGKIGMARLYPDVDWEEVLGVLWTMGPMEAIKKEEEVCAVNHCIVGALLAEHWNLSSDTVAAIEMHHMPQFVPPDSLPQEFRTELALTHLADLAAHAFNQQFSEEEVTPESLEIFQPRGDYARLFGFPRTMQALLDERLSADLRKSGAFVSGLGEGARETAMINPRRTTVIMPPKPKPKVAVEKALQLKGGDLLSKRYKLIDQLGRGAMGAVFKAFDVQLQSVVAIKVLPQDLASDETSLKNFVQEAKAAMALTHPNILRVYNLESDERGKFIVMEYIDGENLTQIQTRQAGAFDPKQAADLIIPICEALHYAHGRKLVHRDIKPVNIMVDREGTPKLADFGIARVMEDNQYRMSGRFVAGTLAYMSPEQISGNPIDARSDIYSLGATLYEMLSGQPPFISGDIYHQVLEKPPEAIPTVPVPVNAVVMKCLAKRKENRYQSAGELRMALVPLTR